MGCNQRRPWKRQPLGFVCAVVSAGTGLAVVDPLTAVAQAGSDVVVRRLKEKIFLKYGIMILRERPLVWRGRLGTGNRGRDGGGHKHCGSSNSHIGPSASTGTVKAVPARVTCGLLLTLHKHSMLRRVAQASLCHAGSAFVIAMLREGNRVIRRGPARIARRALSAAPN